MHFTFSHGAGGLRPSAAGKILDAGADPAIISLAAGNPAPEAFPSAEVAEIIAEEFRRDPIGVLQYSVPQGYPPLRQSVLEMLDRRSGIGQEFDDCIIVSGAQQGGDLAVRMLCDPGDVVLCEEPSFLGCLDAFRAAGSRLVGIPIQGDGIDLLRLEEVLASTPRVRFLYTIPNFQNPTGITMSMEKRRRLYELAVQYNILILEDNPYGDLRFHGQDIPPIKSLDQTGHILYMGSFSKILAPGLRVGYVVAHRELIGQMTTLKSACDVHTGILAQHVCHRFLTGRDMDAHLAGLSALYRRNCERMLAEMDRCFDPRVSWTRPDGGLFLWCTLPGGLDANRFAEAAAAAGVLVVPGSGFLTDTDRLSSSFRLNYSTPTDENIVRGIHILGELTRSL